MPPTGFGVDDRTHAVYRAAVQRRTTVPRALADWLRWPLEEVRAAVRTLTDQGLFVAVNGRLQPVAPEAAAERRQLAREGDLARARAELDADLRKLAAGDVGRYATGRLRPATNTGVDLVTDPRAVGKVMRAFQARAGRVEMSVGYPFPPVFRMAVEETDIVSRPLLDRGVALRGVWDARAFTKAGPSGPVRMLGERGGVRVSEVAVPRIIVWDGRAAVIPKDPKHPESGALVVRQPLLAAAIAQVVRNRWQRSAPWPGDDKQVVLTARDRALLQLMVQGHTDEVIAARLEIGTRTLRRDVGRLEAALNAPSRAALGAAAVRRGIVP